MAAMLQINNFGPDDAEIILGDRKSILIKAGHGLSMSTNRAIRFASTVRLQDMSDDEYFRATGQRKPETYLPRQEDED